MMASPAMPPTTAPAITPPDTESGAVSSLGDGVGVVSGSVVADAFSEEVDDEDVAGDSEDVDEEDVASALRESELKSNVRAVAEGSADDSEEKVSFIRLSETFASGLSCKAWQTLIWPEEIDQLALL
jgi:hypothetical protein